MYVDIVSDLHIEHWDSFPYDWQKNKQSNIVVIAGDISDDILLTVRELQKACKVYKYVIFVDGNHESGKMERHLDASITDIYNYMQEFPNFYSLHHDTCIFDRIAFVGSCLWWNFENSNEIKNAFSKFMNIDTVNHIHETANEHFFTIYSEVLKLQDNPNVDTIVIVTHTVPHYDLISNTYPSKEFYKPMYYNSLASYLFHIPKVKYFIFGHSHDAKVQKLMDKICINNARGRPHDFNRQQYSSLLVDLI